MKHILILALLSLLPTVLLGGEHWWLADNPEPTVSRQTDWRVASRIETAGGIVRLLNERDGKLAPYFESKSPDTAKAILAQMGYADNASAPTHVPVGDGAYVSLERVVAVEFQKTGDTETCILRGYITELGRVSDAGTIKRIKAKLKE